MPSAIIIADSDDEESDYSPPRKPQTRLSPGPGITRSSGHVSHATSSTDPVFFQNIYNEQNDAARDYDPDGPDRSRLSSSEVTAPAPFERTKTGLVDPSSLTSITDPATAKGQKGSSGKGMSDWTEVSTPVRGKGSGRASIATMDDPWDVPSSPDESRPVPLKVRSKDEDNKSASVSALKSKKTVIKLRTSSSKKAALEEAQNVEDDFQVDRRKRRKISHSQASQQGSNANDVDLVTMPLTNGTGGLEQVPAEAIASSMLPPTLPIDNGTSFYVATNPLTDSQKMQYQSVHLASSASNGSEMPPTLPPIYNVGIVGNEARVHESSGSATNINTPRSDMPYHSTAPPPSDAPMSAKSKTDRSPNPEPDSSPDVISLVETRRKAIAKAEEPKSEVLEEARDDEPSEALVEDGAEPAFLQLQEDDDQSDYAEKCVKPKKARGRPKKKASGTDLDSSHHVNGEPSTRQKKKRGRPRKSDQSTVAVEESPEATSVLSDDNAHVEEQEKHDDKGNAESEMQDAMDETKGEEGELGNQQYQEEQRAESEVETVPVAKSSRKRGRKSTKKPKQAIASPRASPPERDQLESEKAEEDEQTPVKDVKAEKPKPETPKAECTKTECTKTEGIKKSVESKGLAAIAAATNKPLYRVGLSKRSRIAPLLKSLRK